MFQSQLSRKLTLAVAAAGLVALAGCSSQTGEATNPPAKPAPKAAAKAAPRAETAKVTPVSAKATPPKGPVITVPKGTQITAIVDQTLHSNKTHQGDTFAASLAAPVKVEGKTVIPKGARVTGKVVAAKKNELKVELASVVVHGKSYDLKTNSRRPSDKLKTVSAKSAEKSKEKGKEKKDNSTLAVKTELTFKLSKPVAVPVKG